MRKDGCLYKEDDRGFCMRLNENGKIIFERTMDDVPGDDQLFDKC
jgi:hypothetical protein